LTNLQGFKNR